jgi:hypothetical protein
MPIKIRLRKTGNLITSVSIKEIEVRSLKTSKKDQL